MDWTNKDITDFTKNQIINLIKQKPILIGHTYTAKQFFETDYEYDLTNCDLVGVPILEDIDTIEGWSDVRIIDKCDNEIKFLVYPDIYKCTYFDVHLRANNNEQTAT